MSILWYSLKVDTDNHFGSVIQVCVFPYHEL